MKILRASHLGMCFGVRDAIALALKQSAAAPLTVLGELVHNETRLLTNAAILSDMLEIDLSRVLAFTYAYACLIASQWLLRLGMDDVAEDFIQWHLKVAVIIEPHLDLP